ncbi:ATP synthase subunit C lysine N-methyltransferase isoform X3 [Patagioenas fasciata]|uniref:ATP synthase subunit C lysine N-methyltransferase isoform X3 n=1 Tax=Patagioenas fasciata TaxID=372321 RepID=UPI003A9A3AAA
MLVLVLRERGGVMAKVLANGSQAAGTQEDCEGSCRRRSWGLLATAGVGGTLVAIYAVATPFVTPALRKVIAAAKRGFKAVGYELNPWLVWYSRYRAWRDGVHQSTRFYISDLWKVSFSHYTNVVVFGVPRMMPQLEKKLEEELECNARIIACRFPFPCWIPDHTTGEGIDTVWAYDLKHSRGCETKSLEITPGAES